MTAHWPPDEGLNYMAFASMVNSELVEENEGVEDINMWNPRIYALTLNYFLSHLFCIILLLL